MYIQRHMTASRKAKAAKADEMGRTRFSFFIWKQYKERITAVLDEGRKIGALPMSCDGLASFINEAIGRELQRVETAIRNASKK